MLGLQDLNQELMEEILLRVPLKTRTKLKSVSKSWRTSISSLRLSMPLRPSSGLVVFLKKSVIQFIQLHDEAFVHTASLHSCFSHSCASLVDSCNGLLLYGTLDSVTWTYHVARSDFDHAVALPPAHSVKRSVCTSLLFDGACYDKFKIMCLFLDEVDCDAGTIQCTVFDSKKCKWREYEARIVNSCLVSRDGFVRGQCFRPSVYSGKRLYCIWSLCLLIYDDEEGFFKLIQLPEDSIMKKSVKKNKNDHWFQLLWESEGQLHFCAPAPDKQGFCIWAYVNDEDNDFMDHNLMWKFKKFVVLKDSLISGQSPKSIRPVAFNDDLQRLYVLVLPARVIASYSFETQNFEKVWSFGEPGDISMPNIFSFLLGSSSQM
ncbi:F-box domain-containing protein [Heracleum sosnowskyi]|uniref:F-box domain-containing protein n=1 Tax=Heracleum sosnowskyi TaxID=360622 RepID=A0AAD8H7N0_9APIA|nr:F-box domain-containing protein [Heracleum sosnowskyi]